MALLTYRFAYGAEIVIPLAIIQGDGPVSIGRAAMVTSAYGEEYVGPDAQEVAQFAVEDWPEGPGFKLTCPAGNDIPVGFYIADAILASTGQATEPVKIEIYQPATLPA